MLKTEIFCKAIFITFDSEVSSTTTGMLLFLLSTLASLISLPNTLSQKVQTDSFERTIKYFLNINDVEERSFCNRCQQTCYAQLHLPPPPLLWVFTFWRILVLVVPDYQQFGQTGNLRHLRDDSEKALHSVIGQNHGCETLGLRWDQWKEEWVAHTAPFLQRKTRKQQSHLFKVIYHTRKQFT